MSQLVDSASGLHPRWSEYYIRTVRADNKDPMTKFLKSVGVPNEPEVFKPNDITVFSFPAAAPTDSVKRSDLEADHHFYNWLDIQNLWCEHKPSVTIQPKKGEWVNMGRLVYENFSDISGISFLPFDDHVYQQAPYQTITKEEYDKFLSKMPKEIDWKKLSEFEFEDTTTGIQTLACSVDGCEVVDIT